MKRLLHRIWRLLPRDLRRGALFRVTGMIAPRRTPGAGRDFSHVVVAGVVGARSGLGQAARGLAQRLDAFGAQVSLFDLSRAFLSDPDAPPPPSAGRNAPPGERGAMIIVVNGPFLPLALRHIGRERIKGRYLVAHWSWELEELPEDWRYGFDRTHEIWVSSEFMARPIRARASCPVHVVPPTPADDVLTAPQAPSSDNAAFTALVMFDMGSSLARKNPLAAIAAFRAAFGDDPTARLIVKMNNGSAYPEGAAAVRAALEGASNVTLVTLPLDRAAVIAMIAGCDVLLSTHRSEGFGLPLFEAMLLGRAVVATGWSANVEFMDSGNSILLPYALVPAVDPQDTYTLTGARWADADVDAAAAALRRLRDDPAFRRSLGAAARRDALAFIARQDEALRDLMKSR